MNIIYIRVSKEDVKGKEQQDPKQQLKEILSKFNLTKYVIFEEKGSAYDISKIKKRKEFLKILNLCFDSDNVSLTDLFILNPEPKNINLYVWDYSRIIRNIELNLLFSILASKFNINIYSYKDKSILRKTDKETPTAKLTRIMMNTISAFSSEEYSYTISENTKKAYMGNGFSSYGNRWGKGFKRIDGTKANLNQEEYNNFMIYIKKKLKYMQRKDLIELIKKEKGILISPSFLSRNFKGMYGYISSN